MSKTTEDELVKEAQEEAALINNRAAGMNLDKHSTKTETDAPSHLPHNANTPPSPSPAAHSLNEEHHSKGSWRSNLASAGLAIAGIGVLAASLAVKIVTLDPLGLATDVASAVSLGVKAVGLDRAVAKAGNELGKSSFLRRVGNGVRAVGMFLGNQPFLTIAKGIGVAAAIATAVTPVGWAIASISAAALAANVAISSVKTGRTERFHHEAKKAEGLANSKFKPDKGSKLAEFLEAKLKAVQSPEFNKKKIAADVGRLSFLDSAATVVSALAINGPVAGVVVGIGMVAATSDAANEAINQKTEENEHRIVRDEAMAKVICARLAEEKVEPEEIAVKYEEYKKEEYAKNFPDSFPEKTGLKRVVQVAKDMRRGFLPFISSGITKLKNFFSKKEEHSAGTGSHAQAVSQQPLQGHQQVQAQAQNKTMQIPTSIEVDVHNEHNPPPPPPAHHPLDPQFMKTHTHVNKTEHGPHLGEGGGKMDTRGRSSSV